MKKLLLDSADPQEISFWVQSGAIHGVTTNPALMAKTWPDITSWSVYLERLAVITDRLKFTNRKLHLSAEVVSNRPDEMISQARDIDSIFGSKPDFDLFVKIPVTPVNLSVIAQLHDRRIKVNATAVMKYPQAIIAAAAGADIVSFFYNRISDGEGYPGAEIALFAGFTERKAKIICGSIRREVDVLDSWSSGADYVTASDKVIRQMLAHQQTDLAIRQFDEAVSSWR